MFFFSSRRRHTRFKCDWSSDVCSSDLDLLQQEVLKIHAVRTRSKCRALRAGRRDTDVIVLEFDVIVGMSRYLGDLEDAVHFAPEITVLIEGNLAMQGLQLGRLDVIAISL